MYTEFRMNKTLRIIFKEIAEWYEEHPGETHPSPIIVLKDGVVLLEDDGDRLGLEVIRGVVFRADTAVVEDLEPLEAVQDEEEATHD